MRIGSVYELEHVSFRYEKDFVLEDVNLSVQSGEYIGIVGENGSGKTTLLRLLIGERKPSSGFLSLFGVEGTPKEQRRYIGYVPQIQFSEQVNFPITCLESVLMGLSPEIRGPFAGAARKERAMECLKQLGIVHLAKKNFRTLSGGLKQRVQIARSLITDPKVLIFDEPTVGVDEESKAQFFATLDHLNAVHGITILMVTHETTLGRSHWKRTLLVRDKRVEDVSL